MKPRRPPSRRADLRRRPESGPATTPLDGARAASTWVWSCSLPLMRASTADAVSNLRFDAGRSGCVAARAKIWRVPSRTTRHVCWRLAARVGSATVVSRRRTSRPSATARDQVRHPTHRQDRRSRLSGGQRPELPRVALVSPNGEEDGNHDHGREECRCGSSLHAAIGGRRAGRSTSPWRPCALRRRPPRPRRTRPACRPTPPRPCTSGCSRCAPA